MIQDNIKHIDGHEVYENVGFHVNIVNNRKVNKDFLRNINK